jgi:hypothetical protein
VAEPITRNIVNDDISGRFAGTSVVVASPPDATETIIASLAIPNFGDTPIVSGVRLEGWAAFTIGTAGVSFALAIRKTNVSGGVVATTGALDGTAAHLVAPSILCVDAAPGVAVYVMTLTVGSANAASTVSKLHLACTII